MPLEASMRMAFSIFSETKLYKALIVRVKTYIIHLEIDIYKVDLGKILQNASICIFCNILKAFF